MKREPVDNRHAPSEWYEQSARPTMPAFVGNAGRMRAALPTNRSIVGEAKLVRWGVVELEVDGGVRDADPGRVAFSQGHGSVGPAVPVGRRVAEDVVEAPDDANPILPGVYRR